MLVFLPVILCYVVVLLNLTCYANVFESKNCCQTIMLFIYKFA